MIRPSLRRFYSKPSKPKANPQANPKTTPFALARPVWKPPPKPVPRTPPKELGSKAPGPKSLGEVTQLTLSPFLKQPQQWREALRKWRGAEELAEVETGNEGDWTFKPVLKFLRQCVVYSIGIFVFGHLFITHVLDMQGTLGFSMLPTIYFEGDWVLINKLYRRGKGVQVGDLVEAKDPLRADGRVLKRIIGMPGDFVVAHTAETDGMMLQVPQGHCFLAGDNQLGSRDSRLYGPVPLALITGKVSYKIAPFRRIEPLENTLKPVDEKELVGSI
ncbi:putative mitochondrial inner membrane protease subunit protein [Venturia nashicola]|uniref:Putative mitochondrial inner membrane protease subunit protein n=1 Tax=Venturia nashicola TaxID=86259 RepID=A0A4Z1P9U4_9PEZI|nr:putative mitochondrial inner membrane protease subunit protein [Venturia nashicola]TLD27806.1 putative mitochondrial inner membrane protease subunit protein [Venturia nashicola]